MTEVEPDYATKRSSHMEQRTESRAESHKSEINIDEAQSISHKNVIEVNRKILAETKPGKVNPIATNNVFDTVGSNGIFQASPSVLKFAGFEANKTHTLKVKIINNSPAPQRLHILPPQTPFFKIRYNKKGMLPTGVSEDIYVQFTPTGDQPYKYYYDTIRIHCEGDKILIPIHAFPVVNNKLGNQIPKVIDLGRNLRLGSCYSK